MIIGAFLGIINIILMYTSLLYVHIHHSMQFTSKILKCIILRVNRA